LLKASNDVCHWLLVNQCLPKSLHHNRLASNQCLPKALQKHWLTSNQWHTPFVETKQEAVK